MTFQQKNVTVTGASFTLLLVLFLLRIMRLVRTESFNDSTVIRLWIFVVVFAIVVTVIGMILTHGMSAVLEVVRTGNDKAEIDDIIDERDQLIDLKGTKTTYTITSLGTFLAIMAFALGWSPLVMISLMLFFGIVGQIAGDARRLQLYQQV